MTAGRARVRRLRFRWPSLTWPSLIWLSPGRLPLRARLTLLLAAVFVVGGAVLVGLNTSQANRSIAAASAASAPAAAQLQQQLGEILSQANQRQKPKAGTMAPPDGKPTLQEQRQTADLKQKLLVANDEYAAATKTDAIGQLVGRSAIGMAALVPLAGLLAWYLAGRSLRPVRSITAAARRTSADRLSERLDLSGPRDEITELATTFDAMMDRLERAFDAQRRFVADASHELRTPIAVAATSIDVVLAKPDRTLQQLEAMAHDVRGALTRVEQLVDSLLALTRSEHLDRAREQVDLGVLAEDALDAQGAAIRARRLTVDVRLTEARTTGDPALLDRMARNLVDNAVRHNVDGGQIRVTTAATGGTVTLTVANTGSVIPPDAVEQLRRPFHRLDGRARTADHGLGLGLAIADAVCRAHGGSLALLAVPSGGLEVRADLPTGSDR
ncbi:sensor histidine kinase [Kribbella sp.]|uniref:sensor histidine kinase n=1 Tax=Kribbella sp. TaxID=1871183 RepID=UPI002D2DF225|nr:ATP-binding protein [Kribbella sp.]HZX08367.1 ATP-binding protein [Kribbella sp.]